MATNVRNTYVNGMVNTASPERLLLMLLDRLRRDVEWAADAQDAGQHDAASQQLLHAQDIVLELRSSLRVDEWDGGPALASLYDWLFSRLVKANVGRDAKITRECLGLIDPLVDAWRQAATAAASAS